MVDNILKLSNISKVYILGNHREAKKAQKKIRSLHRKYEYACIQENKKDLSKIEKKLCRAQNLFNEEKYIESYKEVTGKTLRKSKKPKGVVVHALNGVNLEVKKGDLIAIMGPSGSGKSTLLNMLGFLDEPTTGQIFLKEENVTQIRHKRMPEIRSKELGFVFQSFNLIPTITALENVMLPLKYAGISIIERKEMARKALAKVGLEDRLSHTSNELSGGQRQRVAIARSIVNNPAIIFGDELTGELDTKMTKEIMNLVVKLNKQGQTFIIVTHNPEVAKLCKKTIKMRDGKIEKVK